MISRRRLLLASGAVALGGCASVSEETTTDAAPEPTDETTPRAESTPTAERDPSDATPTGGRSGTRSAESVPLVVRPEAFDPGGTIPERYTGVGEDVSPPLTVESVPSAAATLALVVDDPDAGGFLHWLIWNVPADRSSIPEGVPRRETVESLGGARQGTNDFGEVGYRGPLPPADDGPHTYRFTASAVDTTLEVAAGADRAALESALDGHTLDTVQFSGEFDR